MSRSRRIGFLFGLFDRTRKAPTSANEQETAHDSKEHDESRASTAKPQRFLSRTPDLVDRDGPTSPKRQMWLGVDYGTSRSKLVLTDYGAQDQDVSFPVRPLRDHGGDGDYCIPSTVVIDGDFIRFGFHAEAHADDGGQVYRSLKMLCAYPDRFYGDQAELPFCGLYARDLATLYVGYLVQLGQESASRYASRLGAEPSFGVTMGAPMAHFEDDELCAMFVEVAREAFNLRSGIDLLNGVTVEDAKSALAAVRTELAGSDPVQPRDWVRSEAEAALFWAYTSPDIEDGRYACVDVGAGTTSASWFHITAERYENLLVKNRLAFWGNACAPPGCDAVDEVLAEDLNLPTKAEARGQENKLIKECSGRQFRTLIAQVLDRIANVLQCASIEAFKKDRSELKWSHTGRIFFVGGGSKIDLVRKRLISHRRAWLNETEPCADPGMPPDIVEENGDELESDHTFLLVAYGLARRLADVPPIIPASSIPSSEPHAHPIRRPSWEEFYSD